MWVGVPPFGSRAFVLGYEWAELRTVRVGLAGEGLDSTVSRLLCLEGTLGDSCEGSFVWQARFLYFSTHTDCSWWLMVPARSSLLGREGERSGLKFPPERLYIAYPGKVIWPSSKVQHLSDLERKKKMGMRNSHEPTEDETDWKWELVSSVITSMVACGLLMSRKIQKARTSGNLVLVLLPTEAPFMGILLLLLGYLFPIFSSDPSRSWFSRVHGWAIHTSRPPAWWWRNHILGEICWDPEVFSCVCRSHRFHVQGHLSQCLDFPSVSFWESSTFSVLANVLSFLPFLFLVTS